MPCSNYQALAIAPFGFWFWSILGCIIWQLVAGDLQYDGAQTAEEVVALRIILSSFAE